MPQHPHTTFVSPKHEPAAASQSVRLRYADAAEAQKGVQDDYEYWTGRLTDLSFQLSLAIIGANWAVFGNVAAILHNPWAKASLASIILGIGINLLGTKHLGELLDQRVEYANADHARWEAEYKAYAKGSAATKNWPFTAKTDGIARFLREVKTWAPVLAGSLFLIGLFATHA
jgi:hypothetical protein